jgi:spore germination protein GerM
VLEGGAGDRAVVLVFPNCDGTGYITEERQLPSRNRLEEDLLAVMGALCDGPTTSDAVTAMPAGTRPLAAFYNEADGSVVLDFSRELVTNHTGGSAAERATLATILKTLALNFPEIQSCTLLVDGAESETLAGHLSLDRPLQPRRWL